MSTCATTRCFSECDAFLFRARRRYSAAQQQRRCSASLLLQQMKEPARHCICNLMRKWKQFATITARRRRVNSPDRYYEAFQETLQTLQHRCLKIDCIRATSWTIKYAKRDLPQVTMIILLHRAVTTPCSTSVASALESDFEDIANVAVVVTCSRKAFLRIAYSVMFAKDSQAERSAVSV